MWTLAPGARIGVTSPANHFELGLGRPDYLLIAGGIGVTPIYSHALALAAAGARFRVVYACRTPADAALADRLQARVGERLSLVYGSEGGRIDLAAEIAKLAPGGEAYVCGPIGMLEAAKRAWRRQRAADRPAAGSRPSAPAGAIPTPGSR